MRYCILIFVGYLICCLRDSTPPIQLYFTNEEKQTECVKDMTTFIGCTEEEPKQWPSDAYGP